VVGGCAWQRCQFAKVRVRRRGDADDQLARVGLTVDAAEQLVADCLGEAIGSVRPAGDCLPRCGEGGDRGVSPDAGCAAERDFRLERFEAMALAFPVEITRKRRALASRSVFLNAARPS